MEMSDVWFYLFIVRRDKLFINAFACRMITFVTFETNEDSHNSRDIRMLSSSKQSLPQFKVSQSVNRQSWNTLHTHFRNCKYP